MTLDATLTIRANGSTRHVRLSEYLGADAEELAARQANEWIKSLRHMRVDGTSFRERFTYLGDSLWWFAELYLHKERVAGSVFRAIHAATALLERESPSAIWVDWGTEAARAVLPQLARARGVDYDGPPAPTRSRRQLLRMELRSTALMIGALASPERPVRLRGSRAELAAFVHRAFWRGRTEEGSAESYIGPVLEALEQSAPGNIRYVGVGPATNFRARRWWRRSAGGPRTVQPIEQLAPRSRLAGSVGLWAARHAIRRALSSSTDLRNAAVIGRCDCWPLVETALAGIALLQFPWSARAMDEAGAAFDAIAPAAALTYAEAGGWGRALALEARRRNIRLAGLQHGFIYRHWLNYLHEADEMAPAAEGSADIGFPQPAVTLVFDRYAANHLIANGHFRPETVKITGSPRLDALASHFRELDDRQVDAARTAAGADPSNPLLLLVTKHSEIAPLLDRLLDALRGMPDVRLAIKTHPAETPDAYERAAARTPNVRVLPASADLAALLRASRAVVTVNSTVALDSLALGIPALSIGIPNNLTPFVERGAIAGASARDSLGDAIRRLLYDEEFRRRLAAAAAAVVDEYGMAPDGTAAKRSAAAVMDLARPHGRPIEE